MTASMLDEIEVPEKQLAHVCPCCMLDFIGLQKFIDHLELMKAKIDGALAKVKR